MTLLEFERFMRENSLVVRAIPQKVVHVFEASHIGEYPDGKIEFLPEYHRNMLLLEEVPEHAGMFVAEIQCNTAKSTRFSSKKYYASLEELAADIGG